MFSDKTKAADAEWKIKTFKQGKWNIVDFMIEFNTLAIKANIDELYSIFLLKKNIWQDIIKTILGYLPIVASELLKEWKIAITLVRQGYKSIEGCQDYKTGTGIIYGRQRQPMDIGKSNDNFKDGKPKCFKYDKKWHIAKDCKEKQSMKKQKIQEKSDDDENDKEEKKKQDFGEDLK